MTDTVRPRRRVLIMMLAIVALAWFPAPAAARAPIDAVPASDPVDDTTPDSEVDTTIADTTVPEDESDEMPDTQDDDPADALTWIAVGASILLLGAAVWWMVRREGGDGPDQRMDDDWPGNSEVI